MYNIYKYNVHNVECIIYIVNAFQFYNFVQAMALVVSIIFGFALFTYAFNAYAEASKEQMRLLRGRYEAMATKNAILAFAQVL